MVPVGIRVVPVAEVGLSILRVQVRRAVLHIKVRAATPIRSIRAVPELWGRVARTITAVTVLRRTVELTIRQAATRPPTTAAGAVAAAVTAVRLLHVAAATAVATTTTALHAAAVAAATTTAAATIAVLTVAATTAVRAMDLAVDQAMDQAEVLPAVAVLRTDVDADTYKITALFSIKD